MLDQADRGHAQDTQSRATPARPRRNRRSFVILALLLVILALGGGAYYLQAQRFATTNDAEIDGPIHRVAPRVAGQVTKVLVDDNQHVTKGQVLVVLDDRREQVALDRAQADLAQAKAQLALKRADLAQSRANVQVAEANLYKAKRDSHRYAHVNPQAVTPTTRDAITAELRAATAKQAVAEQQVTGAEAGVGAAKAAVKAASVGVENARLELSYTRIRAPADGHIAEKTVRTGNVVQPGTALMALVGDRIWVTANFKETALARIHRGQAATIHVDAVPGIDFKARVASIQHGTGSVFSLLPAENATGNYVKVVQRVPVRLVFDDPRVKDHLLAPGMSVEPSIRVETGSLLP